MPRRFIVKTVNGIVGRGELEDGVDMAHVVREMRNHRLFILEDVTLEQAPPKSSEKVSGGQAKPRGGKR